MRRKAVTAERVGRDGVFDRELYKYPNLRALALMRSFKSW